MSEARRVVRNSLFMGIGVVVGGLALFLIFVLIARYLGTERFGDFVLILTFASLFQLFADGGVINITIRDLARKPSDGPRLLGSTAALFWLVTLAVAPVLCAVNEWCVAEQSSKTTIYLMGAASLVALQGSLQTTPVRARQDMGIVALAGVAQKLLLLALVQAAIKLDAKIEGIAFAHLLVNVVHWLFFWLFVRFRYFASPLTFSKAHARYLFRESLPLGVSQVLRRLTIHLDTLLLAALAGRASVGLYNSAYRILQMIEIGAVALSGVVFPLFSSMRAAEPERFARLYKDAIRAMVILSLAIAGLLLALGDQFVLLLYGSEYVQAVPILRVLACAFVFLVPGALMQPVFTALGRQAGFMRVTLAVVAVNAALGLFLIPRFGGEGAAIATLGAELLAFVCCARLLGRLGVTGHYWSAYGRTSIAALISAGVVVAVGGWQDWLQVMTASGLYLLSYAILLVVTGAVSQRELRLLFRRPPGKPSAA